MKQVDEASKKITRRQKEWGEGSDKTTAKEIGGPGLSFEKKTKK